MYVIKNDAVTDYTVVADVNLLEDNRILNLAVDNAAARNEAVGYFGTRIVFGRRVVVNLRVDIRTLSEEEIPDISLKEIHIGLVV